MNFYLAVTDINWYNNLSKINPEDVNFWQPGEQRNFRILLPGEPFREFGIWDIGFGI